MGKKVRTLIEEVKVNLDTGISHYELANFLKKGQFTLEEVYQHYRDRFSGKTSMEKNNEKSLLSLQMLELKLIGYKFMRQYDIIKKDFVYYILKEGEDPYVFLPNSIGITLKMGEMADVHIGSNEVDKEELIKVLQYLWNSGYRIITISGDLTDGKNVYKGHDENLRLQSAELQADTFVSIFSMFDFIIIASQGNHDESFRRNGGLDIISHIETKMIARGKQFVYLKSYVGYVVFNGIALKLIHLGSSRGSTGSDTYPSQKVMDATYKSAEKFAKSNVNDIIIQGKVYPIAKMISGHFHGLVKFRYGEVICESPLTFQHTTDFINRMGHRSRVGARISEMTVIKDSQGDFEIQENGSVLLIEYLEELYEMQRSYTVSNIKAGRLKKKKKTAKKMDTEIDPKKINNALKKLYKHGFMPLEALELSEKDIDYINETFHYNILVDNGNVILNIEDDDNSCIISSPLPETGIVAFLEVSNLLIGSKFFNETAFRYILDTAKEQGIKHVHLAGNSVWGYPNKKEVLFTKKFSSKQQADEMMRILSDYPDFHYYAINGDRERTFIQKMGSGEVNCLYEVSEELSRLGIKFTYINNYKCDFIIYGIAFRMINEGRLKQPYTRDYPIVISERNSKGKGGNKIVVDGKSFDLAAITYGSVKNTQEMYYGGTYVTTTSGPIYDSENRSDIVNAKPEAAINKYYVKDALVLGMQRQIIMPNEKICLSVRKNKKMKE